MISNHILFFNNKIDLHLKKLIRSKQITSHLTHLWWIQKILV